jgi:hypothetical protein
MKEIFRKAKTSLPSPVPHALLLDDSAGRFGGEFWCTSQEFSPVDIIPPWLLMFICVLGMNNRPVNGLSS